MRVFQWIAIAGMTLFFPLSTLAIDLGAGSLKNAGDSANINTAGVEGNLGSLIGNVISIALNIIGALLFIYFLYAGFLWMTAQGEPKKVQKAKDIMGNAIAGLVIVMTAFSVVIFLMDELPGGVNVLGFDLLDETVTEAGFTTENALLLQNIGTYISIVLNLLGVVLLIFFLYAGFLWMTAQGEQKQTQKARDIMRNTIIGLIIILASQILASFVINRLAGAEIAQIPQAIHSVTIT